MLNITLNSPYITRSIEERVPTEGDIRARANQGAEEPRDKFLWSWAGIVQPGVRDAGEAKSRLRRGQVSVVI